VSGAPLMPVHEILPLLIGAGVSPITAWAGYTGYKMSMNPKTANGDYAAQQAQSNREDRRKSARGE